MPSINELSNEEIKSIIEAIRFCRHENKREYCSRKYADFKAAFPRLFDAAINDDFSLEFLDMMLAQRKVLLEKKQSVEASDKFVYDKLRERYITPLIGDALKTAEK